MFVAFQPKGCRFESTSSRRVGTLGKSFTRNCSALRRETPMQCPLCSRERLWVECLKGRYNKCTYKQIVDCRRVKILNILLWRWLILWNMRKIKRKYSFAPLFEGLGNFDISIRLILIKRFQSETRCLRAMLFLRQFRQPCPVVWSKGKGANLSPVFIDWGQEMKSLTSFSK